MASTPPPPAADAKGPPPILSGPELYDMLMAPIEPELVSAAIPGLTERYAGESPDRAKERKERYRRAFEEYARRFAAYMERWDAQLHAFKRAVSASLEDTAREGDEAGMRALDSAIYSA